jgi:hypothetical protein
MACGFPIRAAQQSGRCCPSSAADLFGSRSWRATIATQRREIEALVADSPSFRATLPGVLAVAYRAALTETGLLDLQDASPFTVEQALGEPPTLDSNDPVR